MATATINIRMDERTKRDMEAVCKDSGMSMTTAFTIFAKKMGRERRIPFEVSVDPFYSEESCSSSPFGGCAKRRPWCCTRLD